MTAPQRARRHETPEGSMTMLITRRTLTAGVLATPFIHTRRATAAPAFKTVAPGVLTIANSGEMPMIADENGKLIGSDAEIVATIAKKLGLGVKSAQME